MQILHMENLFNFSKTVDSKTQSQIINVRQGNSGKYLQNDTTAQHKCPSIVMSNTLINNIFGTTRTTCRHTKNWYQMKPMLLNGSTILIFSTLKFLTYFRISHNWPIMSGTGWSTASQISDYSNQKAQLIHQLYQLNYSQNNSAIIRDSKGGYRSKITFW